MKAKLAPTTSKTCSNGHTAVVHIARLMCDCGAGYPLYVGLDPKPVPRKPQCENPNCKAFFDRQNNSQKYCKLECRKEHYYTKTHRCAYPDLTTGTVGDIGEFRVVVDLLIRGHDVFRSACKNCWTDVIVSINRKLFSVEVKTGQRTPKGNLVHPALKYKTDILAIVLPDENEVVYQPELSTLKG